MCEHSHARREQQRRAVRGGRGPTAPACRARGSPRWRRRVVRAARCRSRRAEPRRDLHRYDEAGVRLDVESPPARQPCSRSVRNADRRHSPRTRCDRVRERERPDPAAPDDALGGRCPRNPSGAAVDTAQVAPRAPVRESGGERSAALTATRRNDRATRTGAHPETEAVNARAASVVRLERPLALGHGRHSSIILRRRGSTVVQRVREFAGFDCSTRAGRTRHLGMSDCSRLLGRGREIKPRRTAAINATRRTHSAKTTRREGM